ncbi:MAG: SRPBCC family protein [bacterium]|nr:SRPBCC family protein [bacterium]
MKVTVEAKGNNELVISRAFNAPKDLVFKAYTECKYLKRWLSGAEGWSLDVCDVDLTVGGKYRWVWKKGEIEMGAGGEYRELSRPDRIVCTEQFDDPWYAGEAISTLTLEEKDGVTTLTNTMLYVSKEARDTVLQSPMEEGLSLSYDRLEALLAESAQAAGSGE